MSYGVRSDTEAAGRGLETQGLWEKERDHTSKEKTSSVRCPWCSRERAMGQEEQVLTAVKPDLGRMER